MKEDLTTRGSGVKVEKRTLILVTDILVCRKLGCSVGLSMCPIVFSPPNYLGLLNNSSESPCRPVYLYIGLDCWKIILMSNLYGIKYSLVLGFEKCHSLSMQPILKLFLKAVADYKIPDHESLIGFFFLMLNISLSANQFFTCTAWSVDGKSLKIDV